VIPTSTIRIEGGLLGGDLLERLRADDTPGQKPADFGLDPKRNLTDEIAAVYSDAFLQWQLFQSRLSKLPEGDIGTTVTRENWIKPLLGFLGFDLQLSKAQEVGGQSYPISHRADPNEESPPVHVVGYHQELGKVAASGRPRLAPHSLLQEYINRDDHLWGIVTNGRQLRLLRDCTFVKRQAYIDFDLEAIFEQQRYDDFVYIYRLLHRSRFPKGRADADQCLLETYQRTAEEQGGRARDKLRDGVEECLELLGNGFLRHPSSEELRKRLAKGSDGKRLLSEEAFYRQLLLLVYRFLFLLVSEERGLVSQSTTYSKHYSISRIRRLVDVPSAWTGEYDDLWQSLRVLWDALGNEQLAALLEIAPLNGELFEAQIIDGCSISNNDLLEAFGKLSTYKEDKKDTYRRVNYGALDVEELGSVYESLLEFHPRVTEDAAGRLTFDLFEGSERKTTGSYYTPTSLVAELVTSALVPVVEDRLRQNPSDKAGALLKIRVIDPACGSGHFLLAATRYLAKELAKARTGDDEPAPEEVRKASRDVVAHCIYGVDLNPLAVDLCRVALWLESYAEGKPLTFLDHRIRNGNGLVGVFDLECLKEGIPDKAFEALEGDDKAFARAAASQNRSDKAGQASLYGGASGRSISDRPSENALVEFSATNHEVDAIPDDSPDQIKAKKRKYEQFHASGVWRQKRLSCDLWTSAFYQPLRPDAPVITSAAIERNESGESIEKSVELLAMDLAAEFKFFHWPLEFPEVFEDGGFDCVLANPPWERIKLQQQEFFAPYDMRIALAKNKAEREKLIKQLPTERPELYEKYILALRGASASSVFMRQGGRYPLAGRGDINTYAVFSELFRSLIGPRGRAGCIVPTGIATDDTTKFFFQDLVEKKSLQSYYGFKNERFLFPKPVEHTVTYGLLTMLGRDLQADQMEFSWLCWTVEELHQPNRRFTLTAEDIALVNPNTKTCPVFKTAADAELTKAIYRRVPVLWREATEDRPEENPWRITFSRLFDMANDSHHFRSREWLEANGYRLEGNVYRGSYDNYLPLYEAKMLHQFDHRWATYRPGADDAERVEPEEKADPNFVVQPRYWVREEVVRATIPQYPEPLALALRLDDEDSMRHVLLRWAAMALHSTDRSLALDLATQAVDLRADRGVLKLLDGESSSATGPVESRPLSKASWIQDYYPLDEATARRIAEGQEPTRALAQELVDRFSPKWLMGWRDIARSTDIRTAIFSVLPLTAVGHTSPLAFMSGLSPVERVGFVGAMNSIVMDFAARQKVGGTHLTYGLFKQFPVLRPDSIPRRVIEATLQLILSSTDLTGLANEFQTSRIQGGWNETRRFDIRCELDAAFFHLYLPADDAGGWRQADRETAAELTALKAHFPTPRHAVSFMLDSFEVLRKNEEKEFGRFRTKERILEIYDAMLEAQTTGTPFESVMQFEVSR